MSDFIILTDSSADLSGEMAQAADVQVLPLTFTIGGADVYKRQPLNCTAMRERPFQQKRKLLMQKKL